MSAYRDGFYTVPERPEWQEERGVRHGNNRKWKAEKKWVERKRDRKRTRKDWENELLNDYSGGM